MSQINFFIVMIANQFERVFQNSHHPQPKQVYLNNAEIRAVIFIPLHDNAPRHGSRFERNNRIELPLANDHAT